jgi:lipid-binding SYLF domain-containing protein
MRVTCLLASVAGFLMMTGCTTAPPSVQGKADIESDAAVALARAQKSDPTLVNVFKSAAGYAIFPSVGKGAAGIGGAYGKGVLYEGGIAVGYCDMSQASLGGHLG